MELTIALISIVGVCALIFFGLGIYVENRKD